MFMFIPKSPILLLLLNLALGLAKMIKELGQTLTRSPGAAHGEAGGRAGISSHKTSAHSYRPDYYGSSKI